MAHKRSKKSKKSKKQQKLIVSISIALPLVVAILFSIRIPGVEPLSFLPPIYASINGITALLLVLAVIAIKRKERLVHERLMKTCLVLSILFLLMYVAYHMTSDPTPFGGEPTAKAVYLFILLTHIVLSIAIVPLVLITYVRARSKNFIRHKRLARITFPLWLYVTISGVIVYLMISPYYN